MSMIPDISRKALSAEKALQYFGAFGTADNPERPEWARITFGVDTGAKGGLFLLSLVDPRWSALIRYDADSGAHMRELLRLLSDHVVPGFVERLSGSEGGLGSRSASFKQGCNYASMVERLYCMNIPFRLITPAQWQSRMRTVSKQQEPDRKKALFEDSKRLFPHVAHGKELADAILLGALAYDSNTGTRTFSKIGGAAEEVTE